MLDSRQQHRQGIGSDARFGDQFQCLTTACAEAEQLAQALHRYGWLRAIDQAHTDFPFKAFGQLCKHLGRSRMQAMWIGQHDTCARPVRRRFTAQHFQYRTAAGGLVEHLPAAFDQHFAQTLEQGLVSGPKAGQAEQTVERLVAVTQRLLRGDEGEARLTNLALAVQPPQALAQRQRLGLLQHGGKATVDTVGTLQQAGTAPGQFVEVFCRHVQADQLRIQRQRLGRALQQLEQRFGRAGPAQGFGQVSLAQRPGQQLQQAQVFVGTGGNTNGQVDHLPITPVYSLGELQQAYAGGIHQVTCLRRTMGNGDALAKKRGALCLPGLQPLQVTVGDQAVRNQPIRQKAQCLGLVGGLLAHGYLLIGELEHDLLLLQFPFGYWSIVVKFT
ncbi:hypothetical protein D9M71_312590 [compost metagenome]